MLSYYMYYIICIILYYIYIKLKMNMYKQTNYIRTNYTLYHIFQRKKKFSIHKNVPIFFESPI